MRTKANPSRLQLMEKMAMRMMTTEETEGLEKVKRNFPQRMEVAMRRRPMATATRRHPREVPEKGRKMERKRKRKGMTMTMMMRTTTTTMKMMTAERMRKKW